MKEAKIHVYNRKAAFKEDRKNTLLSFCGKVVYPPKNGYVYADYTYLDTNGLNEFYQHIMASAVLRNDYCQNCLTSVKTRYNKMIYRNNSPYRRRR